MPAFVQSLCTYYNTTEAIHNSNLIPLPAHPIFYPVSSLYLCVRNYIKHKHFKIESQSLNVPAELPKWYWYYPLQIMRMIKGRRQMYGRDYTQPQRSGITVDLEDFPVLSQHITVSQVYREAVSPLFHFGLQNHETVLIPSDYTIMPTNTHQSVSSWLGTSPSHHCNFSVIASGGLKYQCMAQVFF